MQKNFFFFSPGGEQCILDIEIELENLGWDQQKANSHFFLITPFLLN